MPRVFRLLPREPIGSGGIREALLTRVRALAYPPSGDPCPLFDGGTVAEWTTAAGHGGPPDESIREAFPDQIPGDRAHAETLIRSVCQELVTAGVLRRVGQELPIVYAPATPDAAGQTRRRVR